MNRWLSGALLAAFCTLPVGTALSQASYTIIDLGVLDGGASIGYGVNDNGQVTGDLLKPGGPRAFVTDPDDGHLIDLGTLGGTSPESHGRGINDSGQVAGYSTSLIDWRHAFVTGTAGNMIDLGTLFRDGASESRGYGINDSGTVTGFTDVDPYGYAHAFVTVGDQMIDLGAFDESDYSYSVGYAINDGAQVTGESRHCISASCGRTLAFLTDPDDGHMIDLGTLEGDVASVGNAINNRGQVAGSSSNNASISHAFVTALTDRHLIDLGNPWVDDFPSCSGQGIDDNGQVVGYCQTDTYPYVYRAFLWDEINGMRDLNTLVPGLATAGWDHLEAAYGISHTAGYITGMGITVADGRHHAFLLVPPPQEYQVEGQILNAFGLPVVGVAIQIGGTIQATTAADGSYSLTLDAGQHTLTPVLAGYLFTPPELTVNGPPDDAQADFLAQLAGDLDGDGCVGRNDVTILLGAVRSGSTDPTTEDVNGDGLVNRADGRALMQLYTNADGACPAFD